MTRKRRRIVVAINPSASFGSKSRIGSTVVSTLRALGHDVVSLTEPDFEQLEASARRAVHRAPDAFVVVGGDGMVHLGVNLLAQTKIPLGIVPSGTGNDAARALGIPIDDVEAAIALLGDALERPPRVIDAGLASWSSEDGRGDDSRWFLGSLSAGLDAKINERANRMSWPRGASKYVVALLVELAKLRPIDYRVKIDGRSTETRGLLACVSNGVSIGGGMKVTPDALLDDGLFDVMIVRPLSRLSFLRIFPRVFRGEHVSDRRVTIERASRVRIEADGIVGYADGERVAPLPLDLRLVPRALRVLAPPG